MLDIPQPPTSAPNNGVMTPSDVDMDEDLVGSSGWKLVSVPASNTAATGVSRRRTITERDRDRADVSGEPSSRTNRPT